MSRESWVPYMKTWKIVHEKKQVRGMSLGNYLFHISDVKRSFVQSVWTVLGKIGWGEVGVTGVLGDSEGVGFPPQMSLITDWGMNGSRGPFRSPQRGDIFCLSSAQLCPLDSESLGGQGESIPHTPGKL